MKHVYGTCMLEDVKINAHLAVVGHVQMMKSILRVWTNFVMIVFNIGMDLSSQGFTLET